MLRRGAVEPVELLVPLRWMLVWCWVDDMAGLALGCLPETPLVEEVWNEKRRLGFELCGGDGELAGLGRREKGLGRERE